MKMTVRLVSQSACLTLLLILGFGLASAGPAAPPVPSFTDSSGKTVLVPNPFKRIISLYSAHTENLCSLQAETLLVGIGNEDDFPPTIENKSRFSYREDPEKFIANRPDLVLVRPMIERSYPEFINKLRRAGITVVSLQPNTIDEMFIYWQNLGLLTGRETQAKEMNKAFKNRLAAVQNNLANVPQTQRPRVYFESIHSKMKTFALESIGIFVLEQAGGINLAADAEQVRETNIAFYGKERLLSRGDEIDIYLAQQGKMNDIDLDTIRLEPGYQAIKAVREGKIHLIAEPLVSRPTMRILDGIEQLHGVFFPQFANTKGAN